MTGKHVHRLSRVVTMIAVVAAMSPMVPASAAGPGIPFTWGSNGSGELGDGTNSPHFSPQAVPGLTDVTELHGGRQHVAALRANGSVVTWGRNNFGQLGVNGGSRNSPTPVPGVSGAIAVETGHYHSVALLGDGTVLTWGYNAYGQLGDGTTNHRSSPVQVSGLNDAIAIAAGRNMTYAVRANGTVWAWGLNNNGQLGDGTTTNRTTPVRVGTLTDVVEIAGGRDHGLAMLASGVVWAWGDNNHGQLGDGTRVDRTNPVQILGGVDDVIAGAHHSYALMDNGTVQAWGRNYRGALGDGTIDARRTSPGPVLGVTNAIAFGAGRDHGLAVLADGSVRAWGYNASGQLGDGTTTTRATAITVPGLGGAQVVAGGRDYSVALVVDGPPPPNQPPTARITASCSALACSLSGSTSTDSDGTIVSYAWTFGDGSVGSGSPTSHTYATAGTYTVDLTVTDDDGVTDTTSTPVTVSDIAADVVLRGATSINVNSVSSSLTIPGSVEAGDQLVLIVTANKAVALTTPSGWTLLASEDDGAPDMRSWLLTRTATAGDGGTTVSIATTARAKKAVTLVAYAGAAPVVGCRFGQRAGLELLTCHPGSRWSGARVDHRQLVGEQDGWLDLVIAGNGHRGRHQLGFRRRSDQRHGWRVRRRRIVARSNGNQQHHRLEGDHVDGGHRTGVTRDESTQACPDGAGAVSIQFVYFLRGCAICRGARQSHCFAKETVAGVGLGVGNSYTMCTRIERGSHGQAHLDGSFRPDHVDCDVGSASRSSGSGSDVSGRQLADERRFERQPDDRQQWQWRPRRHRQRRRHRGDLRWRHRVPVDQHPAEPAATEARAAGPGR